MPLANQPLSTHNKENGKVNIKELRERDFIYLVRIFSRTLTLMLLTVYFQFIHSIRPYNAYNDAILEEYIENTKVDIIQSTSPQLTGSTTAFVASHRRALTRAEPSAILLMKVLLLARIDLLTRMHAVRNRDNETFERLGEEQARQIERLRRINEDFFMRMGHMEKLLQLSTVQIIELRQRVDAVQRVSSDGTFVLSIYQVDFEIIYYCSSIVHKNTRMDD